MYPVVVAWDFMTPFGHGLKTCWEGLLSGRTTIMPCRRFCTEAFGGAWASVVPGIEPRPSESLLEHMLRPVQETLQPYLPSDTRLIFATTVGAIDELENAVLTGNGNCQAGNVLALLERVRSGFGLSDTSILVSAACASSTVALAQAAAWIQDGTASAVLVVAGDSVSEFVLSGFSALFALAQGQAAPFDAARSGLSLGEAAGAWLMMSGERAVAEGRPILGAVAGWGLSCDANHMTGPSRDGRELALAIRRALVRACCWPEQIGSICAHGTGTPYNDAMEMKAFRQVFGNTPRPTYSIKGALGHSLGATGLVEAAIALESLRHARIPPTANLCVVDESARGWVANRPVETPGAQAALSTNSGFGGINAALVLRLKPERQEAGCVPTRGSSPSLLGVGWVGREACGSVRRRESWPLGFLRFPGSEWPGLAYPVRNFGRFDRDSRLVLAASVLALRDAGLSYEPGRKLCGGLIGTSPEGALAGNRAYFADYVQNGRKWGRGNLFLYTLPTSPLAETAIHCGLQGPLYYVSAPWNRLDLLKETAGLWVRAGDAPFMLAAACDEAGAVVWVFGLREQDRRESRVDRWDQDAMRKTDSLEELLATLARAPLSGGSAHEPR